MRRKGPRIDRHAEFRRSQSHSAHMILMTMRDQNGLEAIFARLKPRHIGKDQINARCCIHIWKGNSNINKDQTLFVFWPIAINICVHTNFACSAQRQIDQPILTHSLSLLIEICDMHEAVHGQILVKVII